MTKPIGKCWDDGGWLSLEDVVVFFENGDDIEKAVVGITNVGVVDVGILVVLVGGGLLRWILLPRTAMMQVADNS
eukprot:CAMPEP_0194340552 /NCGR_PEP_ID=MMETSP0171-20130528/86785_1 /TAXON_ID=218684 /ORGANISM="Corethron pennatum, Strain L29A3" /LENGTH=74 /DNA_ID=CAMNT_0039105549 /DNA_START=17 /DNA_END=239 /DNA_ORIENTATION=-